MSEGLQKAFEPDWAGNSRMRLNEIFKRTRTTWFCIPLRPFRLHVNVLRDIRGRLTRHESECRTTYNRFSCSNSLHRPPSIPHSRVWELTLTITAEMRHRAIVCLALKSYLSSSEDFHFPFLHLTFIYRGKSNENVFCRDISPYIRFAPLTQRSETRYHRRLGLRASRLAQQHIHGRSLGNGGNLNSLRI